MAEKDDASASEVSSMLLSPKHLPVYDIHRLMIEPQQSHRF